MITMTEKSSNRGKYIAIGLMAGIILISVVGSFFIIQHWEYISKLERQGFLGLFVISIFAGSPIPIPTPSMILTFTLGSVLNPVLVGLVSGFGNGVGNALIFWTGRGGHTFFKNLNASPSANKTPSSRIGRFFKRVSRVPEFARRRILVAVFFLSIYPNPVLTPMILAMGAMRFRFWKFFLTIWAGKTAQSMILSYLGFYGLRSLLRFMGVFDVP
jgi:membrane protein YqaA with SNARE-associated domain